MNCDECGYHSVETQTDNSGTHDNHLCWMCAGEPMVRAIRQPGSPAPLACQDISPAKPCTVLGFTNDVQ